MMPWYALPDVHNAAPVFGVTLPDASITYPCSWSGSVMVAGKQHHIIIMPSTTNKATDPTEMMTQNAAEGCPESTRPSPRTSVVCDSSNISANNVVVVMSFSSGLVVSTLE